MSCAALFLGEPVSGLRWCAAALLIGKMAPASVAPRRRAPEPVAIKLPEPAGKS